MRTHGREITTASPITELIDSQYGRITYIEWCEKEARRINLAGGNAVVTNKTDSKGIAHCCVSKP